LHQAVKNKRNTSHIKT